MRHIGTSVVVACLLALAASRALAGGFEYVGAGADALGRGGAVTARASNPMVLAYNPAGLVELRGTQFLIDLNLALFHACIDPQGYYGWGAYGGGRPTVLRDEGGETLQLRLGDANAAMQPGSPEAAYYTGQLDTVCLDQNYVPIPQIAWTKRVSEDFGFGFGLIFPSVLPGGRWGGRNGVMHGADGALRPAATRYMLLSQSNLGIFPTIGAAYRLSRMFRLGLAVEWGVVAVNNFTMAVSGGGTLPPQDIVAHVKAQDWFVPAFTASAHVVPIDAIDVVLAFRFQDDIHATGDVDLTTGLFDPALRPLTSGHLEILDVSQRMPWKLRAGIRYADRFAPRVSGSGYGEVDAAHPTAIHDPLQDERWDIELDVEYQLNGRNQEQVLTYRQDQQVLFASIDPAQMLGMIAFPNPDDPHTVIEKRWKDQVSVRLGGSYNILPGLFGISAGTHYETRGVNPDYMQVDFWPVARVGVHGGVTMRIARSIDVVASYAHIFQETIVVGAPPHQDASVIYGCFAGTTTEGCLAPPRQIASIDKRVGAPTARGGAGTQVLEERSQGPTDGTARLDQNLTTVAVGQPPWLINAGRYRSSFDVIAAGVNVHF